jgi:hypothetical protein
MSRHYEVTFRGAASPAIRAAFPDLSVTARSETTTLTGPCLDEAGLTAVIERVQALGLEVIDVHTTGGSSAR